MKPMPIMLAALVACSCLLPAAVSRASARKPASPAQFESSPGWAKIDLRSRGAWQEAMAKGEAKVKLECLMKIAHPATDDDKAVLTSAGFAVHTMAGPILTGSVAARDLPAVANLEMVQAIELAVPLTMKQKN